MDNKSSNRVNMIRTTVSFCDNNTAATAGITAFAGALTKVKNNLVLIDSLNLLILGTSKGVTLDTNLLRKAMSDFAFVCANATFAYAASVNNNTLKAQVNFSPSVLDGQKKDEVDDTCFAIYTATNDNIIAVAPFGAGPADAASLLTAIGLYRTAIQNPRQSIISKSNAVDQLDETIRNTTKDLFKDQMDRMVNTLKVSNFNFWNLYFKAGEIIDLGSTTAKFRGTVFDNNSNPLAGVTVKMRIAGQLVIAYQTTTDIDGSFNIVGITPNDYDITLEKTGFQNITDNNVHISAGQEITRDYTMIP
jgi:hypothetical protein